MTNLLLVLYGLGVIFFLVKLIMSILAYYDSPIDFLKDSRFIKWDAIFFAFALCFCWPIYLVIFFLENRKF